MSGFSSLHLCRSCPAGRLGSRWLSGSLKSFLLGAAVLLGLGTSTSPQSPAHTSAKSEHWRRPCPVTEAVGVLRAGKLLLLGAQPPRPGASFLSAAARGDSSPPRGLPPSSHSHVRFSMQRAGQEVERGSVWPLSVNGLISPGLGLRPGVDPGHPAPLSHRPTAPANGSQGWRRSSLRAALPLPRAHQWSPTPLLGTGPRSASGAPVCAHDL